MLLRASFLIALLAFSAIADEVKLKDGGAATGAARIVSNGVELKPEGGEARRFDWNDVAQLTFVRPETECPGLRAEFYEDAAATRLARVRIDPEFVYPAGRLLEDPLVRKGMPARWTGWLIPALSEKYLLEMPMGPGDRLWLGEKLLVERTGAAGVWSQSIELKAGEKMAFKFEAKAITPEARWLRWTSPSQPTEYVPTNRFVTTPLPSAATLTARENLLPGALVEARTTQFSPHVMWIPADTIAGPNDAAMAESLPRWWRWIVWRARVRATYSEVHSFFLEGEGVATLKLNGKQVFNGKVVYPEKPRFDLPLKAGEMCDIELTHAPAADAPSIRAAWGSPSMGKLPIRENLYRPAQQPESSGADGPVLAEYFADAEMKQLLFARREPGLELDWSILPAGVPEEFWVRHTGRMRAPATGSYKFYLPVESAKLWVDEKPILDPGARVNVAASLSSDRPSTYQLEARHPPKAVIKTGLRWQLPPAKSWEAIAPVALLPPEKPHREREIAIVSPPLFSQVTSGMPMKFTAAWTKPEPGDVVELWQNGKLIKRGAPGVSEFEWPEVPAGEHHVQLRLVGAKDRPPAMSPSVTVYASAPLAKPFDAWQLFRGLGENNDARVHIVGNDLTLHGRGGSPATATDSVLWVYREIKGDFDLSAELAAFDPAQGFTAGLAIRAAMRSGAAMCNVAIGPQNEPIMELRTRYSEPAGQESARANAGQRFLKLQRRGQQIVLQTSADGTDWTTIGTRQIELNASALVGLFCYANDPALWSQATFKSVNLNLLPPAAAMETFTGLLLTDGTFVAGRVRTSDTQGRLRVERSAGVDEYVPMPNVAAILVGSEIAPPDVFPRLKLRAGDVIDAEFTHLKNGELMMSSILFGPQPYAIDNIASLWLAKPEVVEPLLVEHVDGSRFPAKTIEPAGDTLTLTRTAGEPIKLPLAHVRGVRRAQ